jgi:hypothetical protein
MKYLAVILIFSLGALMSSIFEWLHEITTLEIKNSSNQSIRHIDIRAQGAEEMQGRIAKNLKPNKTITFKWTTESEASFEYVVTFEDGHEVFRSSTYTSRGRKVMDEISDNSIIEKTTDIPHGLTSHNVTKHE